MRFVKGRTIMKSYPKAASTVFTVGMLVYFDASGAIIPADATSGDHIGICKQAVAATDDDYASTTDILVEIPTEKQAEIEAEVSGTLTAALVGTTMDLVDADTVNQAATSKNVVTCVGFISATKGRFVLNATFDDANVATT